ncbi:MAG: DUF1540 domain-containing protein [Clostridiales bacterium]|uniref:DUF1540 domain-containing protein n=1 Tax=Terrisporobacter sp. TaxID=1965305 RepID=UPI002A4E0764|nr:DUF1540 domain-containing protein [Terrisporobacter sp.]MCI5630301.1 DUF1540 domain-containing protein [Clostridium sp.]MDD5879031.1 DUF1540 domain-containing protein [Clostridiales bacterium]MCI6458717.1 DUF1540 domain-containing protein [Clostridium sp.]MCI7204478.1 DUF1540 domain-containing protein [Clostridium sp.]MDD7754435.1 DUF1540 domain-containing protein [Clostridiales bacterium]
MPAINCNINNCAHNTNGTCYANKISVNGKKARTSNNTCCSSFVNESGYSNLTNSTLDSNPCNSLNCTVKTCVNNAGNICALRDVSITSHADNANLLSETYCGSFRCK